jgi:predicted Zn finger-like uncharacterized protein
MKFTCDSCSAQYMIADEKVGPAGVKVRCKKCGHVIVLRRAAAPAPEPEPAAAPAPDPAPAAQANGAAAGLDDELGHAFESAFGDRPAAPAAPAPDADATQAMNPDDAARIAAAARAAEPPPTEWYVAIGEVQVGPLPLAEVRRKWEAGEIGPDSLSWRPGMADWIAVKGVPELLGALAPLPNGRPRAPEPARAPTPAPAAVPAPAAGPEPTWKPAGASALAALASEEIAGGRAPSPGAPSRPVPSGVRSLVDTMELPDSGGVDPTGAVPLPIKGLEPTDEKPIRKSSVALGAEAARARRQGSARAVAIGVALAVIVLGGGGAAAYFLLGVGAPGPAAPAATAPVAQAAPAPQPAPPVAPAPAPPAPAEAVAPAAAPTATAAAPAPSAPGPGALAQAPSGTSAPAPADPAATPPPAAKPAVAARPEPAPRPARAEKKPAVRTARATPPPEPAAEPPPAPAPRPAAAKPAGRGKELLDFEGGGDSALDEALGRTPSGRSVYVPPAPGGAAAASALPAEPTDDQVRASVASRIDALRRCVAEQREREPGASGKLELRWTIVPDGGVKDVRTLTAELAGRPIATCITGVVKGVRFPRSQQGKVVTFPFTF